MLDQRTVVFDFQALHGIAHSGVGLSRQHWMLLLGQLGRIRHPNKILGMGLLEINQACYTARIYPAELILAG